MTGQIAGPSIFSLELVGLVIGVSMIVGAVDLIRQPGWAWKRAEESKAAYLDPRPAAARWSGWACTCTRPGPRWPHRRGRAGGQPSLRALRRRGHQATPGARRWPVGGIAAPVGFDAVQRGHRPSGHPTGRGGDRACAARGVGNLLQHRRGHRHPDAGPPTGPSSGPAWPWPRTPPTVPAGWKADPTGRHQFRYWDGFQWTENVADAGEQSRDAVSPR